jgi:hypothetical protein
MPERDPFAEIMRIRGELMEAITRSRELLRHTDRLLREYGEAVDRSRQILDRSYLVIAKANAEPPQPTPRAAHGCVG